MVSFNRVSALAFRPAVLKFGLGFLLCAVVSLMGTALPASAQTTTAYTGGAISVSGLSGSGSSTATVSATGTVTKVQVALNGLTSSGENNDSVMYTSFYLQSPGGQKFELLGCTGDSTDGDDNGDAGSGLDNVTVTIVDTASSGAPDAAPWQHTGSTTVKPSSYWLNQNGFCADTTIPPNASGLSLPQSDGTATLNGTFANASTEGAWTLHIVTDDTFLSSPSTDPVSISSWTLTLTYDATTSASTTTTLSSNANPANSGGSVTFTATVTSTSTVDVGTVNFTSGGTTISGCGAKAVSNGTATCTTTFTQGLYTIDAAYSGGTGFSSSSANAMNQLVEGTTTNPSGDTYCNTGSLPIAEESTSSIYPSIIKVTGHGSQTVSNVEVELLDVTGNIVAQHLLVAPDGVHNLDFLDDGFNSTDSSTGSWLDFYDAAGQYPTVNGAPPENSSSSPADYEASDLNVNAVIWPSSGAHAIDSAVPQIPGTINYGYDPSTPRQNGPITETFESNFSGVTADGDWALYPYMNFGNVETIAGGWCVVLTINTGNPTVTTITSTANPQVAKQSVSLTAAVTSDGSAVTTGGTVTFEENGVTPQGVTSPNNVVNVNTSSGDASLTPGVISSSVLIGESGSDTYMTVYEGDYEFTGDYSGTSSDNASQGTFYQRFNNNAAYSAGSSGSINACNAGPVITGEGVSGGFTPNPSLITAAGIPGTINTMTLTLNGFWSNGDDTISNTSALVEGPTGANLDFFSQTGSATTILGTADSPTPDGAFTFEDSASGTVPQSTYSPGSFKPTSYSSPHTFISSASGFYPVPGTITYAQPAGSGTFANVFDSTNPNGNWKLFFNDTGAGGAEGAQTGWCINFKENPVTVSADASHTGTFEASETNAQITANISVASNTGPTGDPLGTNPLTVKDTLDSNFTFVNTGVGTWGTGWSCSASGQNVTCTNDSAVAESGSYPELTISVNVAASPTSNSVSNQMTLSGAGITAVSSNTDTIAIDEPPTFTSGTSTTFTVGTAGSFTATATGTPAPTFTETGNLPTGVSLSSAGLLSGTPAFGTGGSYPIIITAANGTTNATQDFTLTVNQAPSITSGSSTTFTVGTSGSFTVTSATGTYPTATFTETGNLPTGVTLSTAGVLSGAPAAGTGGTYPIIVTAANGTTNATQNFTLTVNQAPSITSGSSTTFTVGTAGSFNVTAATGTYPSTTFTETGNLPTGVSLSSAGLLSGTPAFGTGGSYPIIITAANGTTNATQNFTLTVNQAPSITSGSGTTFTASAAGSFTVTTATGTFPTATFSETGNLPSGVTFVDHGNGTATISGTAGLAGSYPITITAQNGVLPNGTQTFTLTVNPGAATHLVIPGGPEPFYTAFGFTITAEDAAGNVATSYNGTVAFTSSDPGFVNLGPITLVNGQGTQTGVLKTAGTDTITATDTTNPSITGTGIFTIQPGAATHIGLIAPPSTHVGSPISVTLTAYDLYGNVATSYGGTVVFTSSDPSAILPGSSAITNGTGTFSATMETVGSQTITATDSVNSLSASTGSISVSVPALVVTTASDDTGSASNCTVQTTPGTGTDASCSLRDALLESASLGSGSITFDSTKFATAQTITLSNGTLTIPSNTSINGATSGTGATLANLVTVNGAGASSVFTVASGAIGDSINGLIVTGGSTGASGGGISNINGGTLTINNSTISGNSANGEFGGGVSNTGTLTLKNSTVSGNSATTGQGGGIFNSGTLTVTNSTISGNSASGGAGGGIMNIGGGTLTATDSTISGNTATGGGGIYAIGTTVNLANTIVSGNTADADIDGSINDNGGNQVGVAGINLAPLGSYGGPTQTMPALPGSPAICFGTLTNWNAASLTADQRGFGLLSTYCPAGSVDSGAAQTNYAIAFTTEPPASAGAGASLSPAPVVTLTESGSVFAPATSAVNMTDADSALSGGTNSAALSSGMATFTNLIIASIESGDKLTASLSLNPNLSPALILMSQPSTGITVSGLATMISPTPGLGTVLPATNVTFQWGAGSGVTEYRLDLGTTGPGSQNLVVYEGENTSDTVSNLPANGVTLYARLSSYINGAWLSNDYVYTESPTPTSATLTTPTPGPSTVLGASNVPFQWTSGTGVTLYQLSLSAIAPGQSELFIFQGTAASATVPALPAKGQVVYARLSSYINGAWQFNDYQYTESGSSTLAVLTSPTPGLSTVLGTSDVTFQWTAGTGITEYELILGTGAPGAQDLFVYKGAATSVIVPTLPANGAIVYARLYSKVGGTWVSNDYKYYNDYAYTEGGTSVPAALTSPTPGLGTVLGTSNVSFQWNAGTGVSLYELTLGTIGPGASDLYLYKGTATSASVSTLPSIGVTVYARLYSYINGAWQHNDYVYTEFGTTVPAVLQSPTPGLSTVLGTSNVSFQWSAGTGVTLYQLNLSTIAPGQSELFIYKGSATSQTVPSLPANGAKVYARLYSNINGAWKYNDYVYTEQ
ncbi:MAG: putative Ig domain-containing protein [Terracidiphilus sp.]|jgi:hypothetical protein